MNLLDAIVDAQPDLRPSERKVAEAVLADPAAVLNAGMAGLAAAAGVSEPTVMRFCNAVGCPGFQAFKLRLAQTLAVGIPVTQSAVDVGDGAGDLVEKLFDHSVSSLDRTRRSLDRDAIAAAIGLLAEADELIFVGFGASGIVALDAQQRFPMFGVPCQAPVDAHQQFMAAVLGGPGTVTVAISHTGHTAETLRAARAAKDAGGRVVALTGQEGPLAELADVAILVRTFEDTDAYTPTVSRLAGLVVIDVLATGVLLRHGEPAIARLTAMKERLAAMRAADPVAARST
jgi:RpiR family transcriptional regulator, carbohydrate utilization regulator